MCDLSLICPRNAGGDDADVIDRNVPLTCMCVADGEVRTVLATLSVGSVAVAAAARVIDGVTQRDHRGGDAGGHSAVARFAEDAAGGALVAGAGAGAGAVDAVLEPPEHAPIAAAAARSRAGRAKELWVIPMDVLE